MDDDPTDPTVGDTAPAATSRPRGYKFDSYSVVRMLGMGGMGEVLLAQDPQIGREIAVKRMRDADAGDDAKKRFLREARIQGRLDHPAIVPVHEIGHDTNGNPYFTMKRLAGITMAQRLEARGSIQPLLRALIEVCFAIDLAHSRGIVHRDLKPANIMLGNYGEVYVLDWGVARVLDESEDVPARASAPAITGGTATGVTLGTIGYMAPEQLRGERAVGTAVDLYSLGAILFEILAGEPLHPRGDAYASTLEHPTAAPGSRRPDRGVPPELDALCLAALASDPAQRPTARAFAETIQRYLDGDRDLELRRSLSAAQLDAARGALAAGKRADGIFAAGRALALDPESTEASQLVLSLMVEPPQPLPDELEAELARGEQAIHRERSRRASVTMLALLLVLPLAAVVNVASWPALSGLLVATLGMSAIGFVRWRFNRAVPLPAFIAMTLVFVIMFSRLASPLLITPVLVCVLLVVIGGRSTGAWAMVVFATLAIVLPLGLERIGWLSSTLESPRGPYLWLGSAIFDNTDTPQLHALGVTFGTLALTLVSGMFVTALERQRKAAQRAVQIQGWSLQQLLPGRARS